MTTLSLERKALYLKSTRPLNIMTSIAYLVSIPTLKLLLTLGRWYSDPMLQFLQCIRLLNSPFVEHIAIDRAL